jgi:glycine/D-amino acid oxidase-like deaminating enzyme
MTTDVLVIGGGILGTAVAYYLANLGVETMVVERGELNREASGTNAGSLHFQILRQLDYSHETLGRIRPTLPLYREAARVWPGLAAELGADLELHQSGGIMVAQTRLEFDMLDRKVSAEREMGLSTRLVSRREALELCPHLSDDVMGGAYCPDEGSANPFLATPAYAAAAARAGALIRTHTEVSAISHDTRGGFVVKTNGGAIHARRIVNAAGPWAASIAAMVGADLPVWARPIQVSVTTPCAPMLGQMIQHVRRRLTLKQTPVGTFLIGGGWPASTSLRHGRSPTTWESTNASVWVASSVFPFLSQLHIVRTWAGLIPTTPRSMVPLIGEFPDVPNFHVVSSGVGFTLAPVLGALLAESIAERRSSPSIERFRPRCAG